MNHVIEKLDNNFFFMYIRIMLIYYCKKISQYGYLFMKFPKNLILMIKVVMLLTYLKEPVELLISVFSQY